MDSKVNQNTPDSNQNNRTKPNGVGHEIRQKMANRREQNTDQLQKNLREGFQWTTSHSKMVLGAVAVFLVVGIGISIAQAMKAKNESAAQEKYYVAEKRYNEKKMSFDQAEAQKNQKQDKNAKTPAAPTLAVASGDLQKDYGDIPAGFESILKENPKSLAAQMAALNLSELYLKYSQPQEALRALDTVAPHTGQSEMLAALVLGQKASIQADQNQCAEAVKSWEKIVSSKKMAFAHDEAKLRMGLCYETMNDLAKAEQMYSEVAKKDDANNDFSASRDAEKYLRLLKMKMNSSGSGT